jgi:hypothetical protein
MKLQEIISNNKSGTLLKELIQITTPYIPLLLKRQIRNTVVTLSTYVDEETNMMRSDKLLMEMYATLMVCLECTDIELDELVNEEGEINIECAIEAYDELIQSGVYSYIMTNIANNDIDALVEIEIQERLDTYNSVASVLNRAISSVMKKLPSEESMKELLTQLPTQLAGLKDLNILGTGGVSGVTENRATRRSKKKE